VFRNPVTGQTEPWFLGHDGAVQQHQLPPAFSTNDLELELQVVLAGQVIGQLTNLSAAPYIRTGRLVPLLLPNVSAHYGVYLYYGSRTAQPSGYAPSSTWPWRLHEAPAFVLGRNELETATQSWRRARRRA
jgi:DNA-binding transcriptional LysR family regulator